MGEVAQDITQVETGALAVGAPGEVEPRVMAQMHRTTLVGGAVAHFLKTAPEEPPKAETEVLESSFCDILFKTLILKTGKNFPNFIPC